MGFVSSGTALSVIENVPDSNFEIEEVYKFGPFLSYHQKTRDHILSHKLVAESIIYLAEKYKPHVISIEEPFLQGESNKHFNKFLGLLENKIFNKYNIIYIAPLSVKKYLGSGKMEKDEMAKVILDKVSDNESKKIINKAIKENEFDITDSIAIGMAGYDKFINNRE